MVTGILMRTRGKEITPGESRRVKITPGGGHAGWRSRRAERGPVVISGPGGGEEPADRGGVGDLAAQGHANRLVEGEPVHGHLGLLVLAGVPVSLGDRRQPAG